jgi:DNA polymerase III epsilon subunit-like protein
MIVLDVETTGVDPELNSLVSVGAVEFESPENRFYMECRVWDGARIEQSALAMNGMSESEVRDTSKPSEAELVGAFIEWLRGCKSMVVIGHNPSFDLGFIRSAARRAGINSPLAHRSIDIHSVAAVHILSRGGEMPIQKGKSDLDSDKVMKYVGIPTEPRPHKAINGALWETEAFSRLAYGRNCLPEFKQYPLPDGF